MDNEGFATSTQIITGKKYWVIFMRDSTLLPADPKGDVGSISFTPSYQQFKDHNLAGWFSAEAVELCPGDVL